MKMVLSVPGTEHHGMTELQCIQITLTGLHIKTIRVTEEIVYTEMPD
ncbi:hypothetical protein SDC9_110740 [bioreactor metagenome]|uniref:Uncharacterized protein n=1 Tax=bioreactor metagenome TaxID=1076179 RepID=A0A645BFF3_9ZZZZ